MESVLKAFKGKDAKAEKSPLILVSPTNKKRPKRIILNVLYDSDNRSTDESPVSEGEANKPTKTPGANSLLPVKRKSAFYNFSRDESKENVRRSTALPG